MIRHVPILRGLVACFAFALSAAWAHNVVGSVFVDGDRLEGAFGFSNGDLAPAGVPVQLLAPDGSLVAEAVTDEQGGVVFQVREALAYQLVADLGQGHVSTVDVVADDIALPQAVSETSSEPTAALAATPVAAAAPLSTENAYVLIDPAALDAAVSRAVAAQVKPLRRELVAMQSATRWSDILGGLGVILGVCGAAALWLARRERAAGGDS